MLSDGDGAQPFSGNYSLSLLNLQNSLYSPSEQYCNIYSKKTSNSKLEKKITALHLFTYLEVKLASKISGHVHVPFTFHNICKKDVLQTAKFLRLPL